VRLESEKRVSTRRFAAVLTLGLIPTACVGQGAPDDRGATRAQQGVPVAGRVLVSAASSLSDAFADIESAFEATEPGIDVVLNFGASSSLRVQILEGAPVDVFAPANASNMHQVAEGGYVSGEARIFARNVLQIAVPRGNPAGIRGLADFSEPGLRLGLCAGEVPCGDLARQALRNAGVVPAPDTNEPDVRALLTKIELGELDAGITYVTDVASSRGTVQGIDIPTAWNVVAEYPIAVLADAPNPGGAEAFARFVLSDDGRAILARYGFATP